MNFFKNSTKQFSHQVRIKFIGKRTNLQDTDHHDDVKHVVKDESQSESGKINEIITRNREQSLNSIRNLWVYRRPLSDKEVDEYNNGIQVKDWTKIKVGENIKH